MQRQIITDKYTFYITFNSETLDTYPEKKDRELINLGISKNGESKLYSCNILVYDLGLWRLHGLTYFHDNLIKCFQLGEFIISSLYENDNQKLIVFVNMPIVPFELLKLQYKLTLV
jgi:hypothetical protein